MPMSRFIIANVTWNESGWRSIYVNPRAGHRYAREHPGHESLNFDFNKKGLDTDQNIFGYVQWRGAPRKFQNGGMILFYSKNLKNGRNEIIGVYGHAEILKPYGETKWKGFEADKLISNIKADKELSILFPIPLNADKYSNNKRLVPQAGLKYIDLQLASRIISDEIEELKKSGIRQEEYLKLTKIFEYVTGSKYEQFTPTIEHRKDEDEQKELEIEIQKEITQDDRYKNKLIQELKTLTPQSPEKIEFKGKYYKRDNKTLAALKLIRNYKCQICGKTILKKDGSFYIEAAHIKMKSKEGPETPDNILVLCPNHHKEFDLGNRKILEHTKSKIRFELNGESHGISLSLD